MPGDRSPGFAGIAWSRSPVDDGILDRLVHNAHRIEMKGDSMRKNRNNARSS
jgi:DNA replication protein DnaC